MFIPDSEKEGREGALKKLLRMMGQGASDDVMSFKSSRQSGDEPLGDEGSEMDMEMENGDELMEAGAGPDEDEKALIAELYSKYCM